MILTSISCAPLQGAAEQEWKRLPHKTIIASLDCQGHVVSNKDWLIHCNYEHDQGLATLSIFETGSWRKKELILKTSINRCCLATLKFSPATPDHVAISWKNREHKLVSAIYDIKTCQPLIHFNDGRIVGFSPDGTVLAARTESNDINLFRTNERVSFASLRHDVGFIIHNATLLSNTIIALDNLTLEQIQFFDITTREKIHTIKPPDNHNIGELTLTSNGQLLIASSKYSNFRITEGTITLLDPITMNTQRILASDNCAHHVTLLPNEQEIIASTGLSQGIHLFGYNDRNEKTRSLKILSKDECHKDRFTVSPDGTTIIAASEKGLTYYDLPTLKQEAEERQKQEAEERRQEALALLPKPAWLTPSSKTDRATIASRMQKHQAR